MKNLIYLLFVATIISSCQQNNNTTAELAPITIDSVAFQHQSPPHITKNGDTLMSLVNVMLPKLSGGNDSVIAKINRYIAGLPVKGLSAIINPEGNSETQPSISIGEAAKTFFNEASEMQKETPDAPNLVYTYEADGDTLFISPNVISLHFEESTYTGGAHGNYNTSLLNFDAQTGNLLILTDMVKDTVALKKIAEVKFKETETQMAKENNFEFNIGDYFFADGKFALPNNIGITKRGLQFLYNPYEAASYARGQIIFEIPWKDLKGIIVEKYAGN